MAMKRYSRREPLVFIWVMVPYIVFMNLIIFGTCIFDNAGTFFKTYGTSTIYFFGVYAVFGTVAVGIKNRFPAAGDLFRRVSIMLPVFYTLNIAAIAGAYALYRYTGIGGCEPLPAMFWYTVLYGCLMSTVITFINEGMANWESWKSSLAESARLTNSYRRSKLLGLKGQINPHFLFNCFNTLSGLIHEDEEKAEKFLDEMTRVHRYLLRSDDEFLVTLKDEIRFAESYLYLTSARFGNAISTRILIPEAMQDLMLPPLSMHVILENIIYTNALSKQRPLQIEITVNDQNQLEIQHSLNEKTIVQNLDLEEGLDNLLLKYKLLDNSDIKVEETDGKRSIILPLFKAKEALVS